MRFRQRKLNQVFICYRREGSSWVAGRIYDSLVRKFGRDAVFKDIDSIPLGINFREHIESAVQQCSVFLVVIYNGWMGERVDQGTRRIDDPNDFIRIEIEAVLQRQIPVIPLLIEDTSITSADSLPSPLNELGHRNGMRINNDPQFHMDMDRLINRLEPHLQFKKTDLVTLRRLAKWMVVFIVLLLVLGVIIIFRLSPI
jgi:hypothetical protein